ncbi:hypothetical protein PHLCEN_2v11201 [Hermanssonia centrifuga]|uniref:Uncharacterized protein n=1 Tax=Hermanssonia centrifuga TaxID=98765 RepID=A0A2R6NKR3_9APHY|nr:hypothetical protein PHLCEN_2v11201 [Hermanssonia centrifuga]
MAWIAPIQMVICLILLLVNLGPSALAGYAFFVLCTPVQTRVMRRLMGLRQKSMIWTDKRAKLLQELLGGMKIIKYFAWEVPYLKRIGDFRSKEIQYIRSLLMIRSANNAVAISLPALASVLSFVVYSLSGHSLNAANIFASLTLFQLLRLPLMFLPLAFSSIADAQNALNRLYGVFEAETLSETKIQDPKMDVAVSVVGGDFTWDSPPPEAAKAKKKGHTSKKQIAAPAANEGEVQEKIFNMKDVNMEIPMGQLTAIVGPVGTGKTSLLEAMIGEMRRTAGTVRFNGTVAYCPQSAWIQNATIRDNITFGRPFEEERYWKAIRDACLDTDLDMMPHGDLTEVGERGISLSGGQKQRINICRAIYVGADIQIFDDPLSALDAHVGKSVFHNVFLNASAGKTRILVTHAIYLLPQVDYIYTVVEGKIAERGTYEELLANDGAFSRFAKEFGAKEEQEEEEEIEEEAVDGDSKQEKSRKRAVASNAPLMQAEERNKGAVSAAVYKRYLKAGKGSIILPLLILSLAFMQGTQVMSSYWLVYWQERKWPLPAGFYMGVYGGLGAAQAFAFFWMGLMFALLTYYASRELHRVAIRRVMYAPMSFFETTPLGRIMNRFSKDIDTIDNMLGDSLRMFFATLSNIMGAIILIAIILPWFLIAVCSISIAYLWAAMFYRASARELKAFGWMVRQSAEVENNMNSVERIIHYASELEQEPPHLLPDRTPPAPWPAKGAVEMNDVVLKYRPELPEVLKGMSMSIQPGEKVGIVGRTGAGKSSIMTALYRLVELTSGSIVIDGVDISQVGLTDLRRGLAIIPQDPLLFSGTLRTNLDPFGDHDDARLWDALKRSYLVEDRRQYSFEGGDDDATLAGARTPTSRFSLDSLVEDEGGNLSVGQRSLVSLARAMVLQTKILILDEATASVDYETDKRIQDTIATEFKDRTILCIARE